MKKELKDYLHLYLGCEVLYGNGNLKAILVDTDGINANYYTNAKYNTSINRIKPILRPLSDMNSLESTEYNNFYFHEKPEYIITGFEKIKIDATAINFLRSKKFDVDGLIEAGVAIDATTIKTK